MVVAVVVVVTGIVAVVIVVVTVLVGTIDFDAVDATVSLDAANELFGEPNNVELNPGNEILSTLDDGPVTPHSSNDNRFALGFFFAFNS